MSRQYKINSKNIPVTDEPWWASAWRPAAAAVYLLICLVDFVIMPVYYEYTNSKMTADKVAEIALKFEGGGAQVEALRALREERSWKPITLAESGLFHIAFGAILGAAAWTRGREKSERIRNLTDVGAIVASAMERKTAKPKADNPDAEGNQ